MRALVLKDDDPGGVSGFVERFDAGFEPGDLVVEQFDLLDFNSDVVGEFVEVETVVRLQL